MQVNLMMLGNLLAALETAAPALQRVVVLQGAKAYGTHVARMRLPGKQSQPGIATRTSTGCKKTR